MNEQINGYLKDFGNYHLKQLDAITTLEASKDKVLFKKILYIAFIESLAKARYSDIGGAKKRFLEFLKNCTTWDDYNTYSFIHISKNKFFSNTLYIFCTNEVDKLLNGRLFHNSMIVSNLQSIPPEYLDSEKDVALLESCTYGTILYNIRNGLVHQFQASTEPDHPAANDVPYFTIVSYCDIKIEKPTSQSIEMIFPNTFLEKLAKEGLDNFLEYCKEKELNPFEEHYDTNQVLHKRKM